MLKTLFYCLFLNAFIFLKIQLLVFTQVFIIFQVIHIIIIQNSFRVLYAAQWYLPRWTPTPKRFGFFFCSFYVIVLVEFIFKNNIAGILSIASVQTKEIIIVCISNPLRCWDLDMDICVALIEYEEYCKNSICI